MVNVPTALQIDEGLASTGTWVVTTDALVVFIAGRAPTPPVGIGTSPLAHGASSKPFDDFGGASALSFICPDSRGHGAGAVFT